MVSLLRFFACPTKRLCRLGIRFTILVAGTNWLIACQGDLPSQQLPAPTADPCALTPADKYYFTMSNQLDDKYFESDTIFPGTVRFSAPPVYQRVTWRIGNDPRLYTATSFNLGFPAAVGSVQVQFFGTRPIDKCLTRDDGVDTLAKTLTVLPFNRKNPQAAIEGKYVGAISTALQDTFRVRVFVQRDPVDTANVKVILYNLNKGCPGLDINIIGGYKALVFNQTRGDAQCHGIYGSAALDPKDRNLLRVQYQEQVTPGQPQTVAREFIGRRVR